MTGGRARSPSIEKALLFAPDFFATLVVLSMLSRTFFYALVAINILLAAFLVMPFFGMAPEWSSATEPERLARQLSPDTIKILPAGAQRAEVTSSGPSEAPSGAASVPLAAQPESPARAQTEVTVEVEEFRCIAFKGLSDENAARVLSTAGKQSAALRTRSVSSTTSSFWVHIPPDGGKEAAEKRAEVLQRNGISDFFVVREAGETQYAVSLGLYRAEALAKRRLESLQKVGIKTALIAARENAFQRVEVRGDNAAMTRFVLELGRKTEKPLAQSSCEP